MLLSGRVAQGQRRSNVQVLRQPAIVGLSGLPVTVRNPAGLTAR